MLLVCVFVWLYVTLSCVYGCVCISNKENTLLFLFLPHVGFLYLMQSILQTTKNIIQNPDKELEYILKEMK